VSRGKPYRGRAITLKAPKKLPRILTVAETQAVLDACTRLRDRFFFALMHETGCRAGEVLGLRHEDIAAAECEISIVPRENANGARAKSGGRTVPVGPELIRLYADYLHEEYGDLDSDYVLSGHRHNTYCPEPGVIQRGAAPLPVISATAFQGTR